MAAKTRNVIREAPVSKTRQNSRRRIARAATLLDFWLF
jgi:hypothetical protein